MDDQSQHLTLYAYIRRSAGNTHAYHAHIQSEPKEPSEIFCHYVEAALAQRSYCHWMLTLGGWNTFPFTFVYVCFEGSQPSEEVRKVLDSHIQREVEKSVYGNVIGDQPLLA